MNAKEHKAIVQADCEMLAEGLVQHHTGDRVKGKLVGMGISNTAIAVLNGLHQGFLYSADHDIDRQRELCTRAGIRIDIR